VEPCPGSSSEACAEPATVGVDVVSPSQEDRREAEPEEPSPEPEQPMELLTTECRSLGLGLFYGSKPRAKRIKPDAAGSNSAAVAERPNRSRPASKRNMRRPAKYFE